MSESQAKRFNWKLAISLLVLVGSVTYVGVNLLPMVNAVQSLQSLKYVPTTEGERRTAIGDLSAVSQADRKFLDGGAFVPLGPALPGDWNDRFPEPRQSYGQFVADAKSLVSDNRRRIYLMPLGSFPKPAPSIDKLREFTQNYLGLETVVLPGKSLDQLKVKSRINEGTQKRQYLTTAAFEKLQPLLPADGVVLVGVTMDDLYPSESWNFVFGQAAPKARVAVHSFARYDPSFFGEARPTDVEKIMLRRAVYTMAHETLHMFGINHCKYYECVMDGSNTLEEMDRHPLHLCPVDLRKVKHSFQFDIGDHYRKTEAFCKKEGLGDEATWLEARLLR